MATELRKFTEAYATMTVAVYEPLILQWYSSSTVAAAAAVIAHRVQKAKRLRASDRIPTVFKLQNVVQRERAPRPEYDPPVGTQQRDAADLAGGVLPEGSVKAVRLAGFPDAAAVGDAVYTTGVLRVQPAVTSAVATVGVVGRLLTAVRASRAVAGNPTLGAQTIPVVVNGSAGFVDADFDYPKAKRIVTKRLFAALKEAANDPNRLSQALIDALKNLDKPIDGESLPKTESGDPLEVPTFLPERNLLVALSPIGVAHYYRQLYFNTVEGFGPIEEAFTIAPKETLEVVYETVRRQIHEELVEVGSETVSEAAEEVKNLDEVSDKVSSMVQRDASAGMSANASGSIGVWQVGASASANMAVSSQRSREETSRRLKETTRRASERITKTYSLKTRDIEDVTTANLTRRVIKNEDAEPVSYGLRRVLRRVRVKVQDLGPRLVWQLYVRAPGEGLARSRFVHFRESGPIAVPDVPPGVPPRPLGGTDTGSTSSTINWSGSRRTYFVTLSIQTGGDRKITSVSIDSITDLEGGGKDDEAPSPINTYQWDTTFIEATRTFTTRIAINKGDSSAVSISYTYAWEPSGSVMDEWETKRAAAVTALLEEALNEQFERDKKLITERSKIKSRPANDLRREERYEVMNRMVSHLFAGGDDPSEPIPLEIEFFHRYFEIDAMFTYTHPSWWKPRYARKATGLRRDAYEITAESEPAPMGSSLAWAIQLDGDTRRNEFINSPWVRVCLPIRANREREAIEWLAKHVEGEFGYDPTKAPLKDVMDSIAKVRENQEALGQNGAEYVTVNSAPGAPDDPLKPEGVYPVIDEFEVTVPTDGFVYDRLIVVGA